MANKNIKVGLALGGGSARGLAHIGVLEVLQREGIPIDMIAGTSAGALVGAIFAKTLDARTLKEQALALDWKRLAALVDLALPVSGFIGGRKITLFLKTFMGGDVEFDDLKMPLSCVAADIMTGEEVVIKEGSVLEAVRASISLPVIFTLVKSQGRYLVDGGLVDPVPVSIARDMGADFVIAVNVLPDVADVVHYLSTQGKTADKKEPRMFTVILHSLYLGSQSLADISCTKADFVIRPKLAHIGPGEFLRGGECIREGERAALEVIAELRRHMELKSKTQKAPVSERLKFLLTGK